MTVKRTIDQLTRPAAILAAARAARAIWRRYRRPRRAIWLLCGAAQAGDLAALGDESARGVPHLSLLVEPSTAHMAAARSHPERPGRRHRAHIPGELHGGRPADRAKAEHHRRERVHREGEQVAVRIPVLTQLEVAAHLRVPAGFPPSPPGVAGARRRF